MKSFKEFISDAEVLETVDTSVLDNQSLDEHLDEGFVAGGIIAAKLNTMKNRVLSEQDPKRQNDILAKMLHFGFGSIALVTNHKGRKR